MARRKLFISISATGMLLLFISSCASSRSMPPFVTACLDKSAGVSCGFHTRNGRAMSGRCQDAPRRPGTLVCRPDRSYHSFTVAKKLTEHDCGCTIKRDLKYRDAYGWDSKFTTINIYSRDTTGQKPVLLFVHGGGWVEGDKDNLEMNPKIVNSFLRSGFVVASVNFRLIEKKTNSSVKYRDMLKDIARSMKWLNEHDQNFGARPNAFVLVGYSSGAHLVSLIATDERYLESVGLSTDVILGVSAWDVPAYDIPLALKKMKNTSLENKIRINKILFGSDTEEQENASPMHYLDSGAKIPFQLLSAGIKEGKRQTLTRDMAESFKEALINAGHEVEHYHYENSKPIDLPLQYGTGTISIQKDVEHFLKSIVNKSNKSLLN